MRQKDTASPHLPPQRTPVPSHRLCPMSSVSAWSTAAAGPKYDGARHTLVSRHFCICGADLESWVHCVVHIFYPFWPNWMEGNKGIPACLKCPSLPDLGLAGKPVPSELLYKLVPSTNIIRKNRLYVNVENKKFYFFFILRNMQKKCNHQRGGRFLGFIGLWIALTGNEFIELSSPLRGAPSKRRSLRCSIYLSASYGMISIMKSATSGVFFPPFGCLTAPKECASELDS